MPCRILKLDREKQTLLAMLEERRASGLPGNGGESVETGVKAILEDIRQNGLDALLKYSRKFDCATFTEEQLRVSAEAVREASASVDPRDLDIIAEACGNIREFHEAQKEKSWFITRPGGFILGQKVDPVAGAGLYVPGGREGNTPLVSSLLMAAVPARVAGVGRIAVVTPPRKDGSVNPYILAAAGLLGITEIYACGGPWAVAALAFGAGPIKPVDVIAGPGNIWVATAKRLLIGQVGIDMLAGPSEVAIWAAGSGGSGCGRGARPEFAAADMLAQAEHDCLSSALCITDSEELARAVREELRKQLADLPRRDIAAESLRRFGAIVLVDRQREAVDLINSIAPEHLELMCGNPWEIMPQITGAGAIFMDAHSPEALGDYYAGPNHVLPTMGTARFASALSVQTFCKRTSVISAGRGLDQGSISAVARLARLEKLEGHARSVEMRARAF
ncbi:MAG: histidinol dehydrogenase [Deltaproteobacteria bacterium]|jgi:histidinol dehydrogenase|nr:histidinol dehydrogenase [Deltaproteobacteria bacterium]